MSKVKADYEELRRYAARIEKYLENITTETNGLVSGFKNLEDTWQDQQKNKFKEELMSLLKVLKKFKEESSKQIPHLKKLAQKLEDYHRS